METLNNWLDKPSTLYTQLMGEKMTNREAIRVNLIAAVFCIIASIA